MLLHTREYTTGCIHGGILGVRRETRQRRIIYTVRSGNLQKGILSVRGNLQRGILSVRRETRIRRIIVRGGNLHRGITLMPFLFRPGDISIHVAVEITVVCGIQFPI